MKNTAKFTLSKCDATVAVIGVAIAVSLSCGSFESAQSENYNVPELSAIPTTENRKTGPNVDESFSFRGVTIFYDRSITGQIVARNVEAYAPEDPTFRPDGFEPDHIQFTFQGGPWLGDTPSGLRPEITVFSIPAYERHIEGSGEYLVQFKQKLKRLQSLVESRPSNIDGEYPYLRFLDATQTINTHLSYGSFRNGKGMFFLTHFGNSELAVISNDSLVYVFQGITTDGKYLVSATFPVTLTPRPDEVSPNRLSSSVIQEGAYEPEKRLRHRIAQQAYLERIRVELGNAADGEFEPNLQELRKMILSLEVNPLEL